MINLIKIVVATSFLCVISVSSILPGRRFTDIAFGPRSWTHIDRKLWNFTIMDNLKTDLLKRYDRNTRPSNHNESTKVELTMRIFHIEVNEMKSVITTHCWMSMEWNDIKLKWNKEDYENISMIHVSEDEIWKPDVSIYNSAVGNSYLDEYKKGGCVVKNEGNVTWIPPLRITSFCDLDLSLWPFDSHNCTLTIGSWIYDGNHINLTTEDKYTDEKILDHGEWRIVHTFAKAITIVYECCPEPYVSVEYKIWIERKSTIYRMIVYGPVFFISSLILISCCLSSYSLYKYFLNGSIGLICCGMLLYFSSTLPNHGEDAPVIVKFYYSTLNWIVISTLILLTFNQISRSMNGRSFPEAVKQNTIFNKLNSIVNGTLLISNHSDEMHEIINSNIDSNNISSKLAANDWENFMKIIDKLVFIVFALFLIIWAIRLP